MDYNFCHQTYTKKMTVLNVMLMEKFVLLGKWHCSEYGMLPVFINLLLFQTICFFLVNSM
jgi:hypothetical protein